MKLICGSCFYQEERKDMGGPPCPRCGNYMISFDVYVGMGGVVEEPLPLDEVAPPQPLPTAKQRAKARAAAEPALKQALDEVHGDPRRKLARQQAAERRAHLEPPVLVVGSLGWGVQSTTLAVLAALRDERLMAVVDRLPDVWIHADTRSERKKTYMYIEQMTPWFLVHGIRIETVTGNGAGQDVYQSSTSDGRYILVPAFTTNDQTGKAGQMRRQCTSRWKIEPQDRWVNAWIRQSEHTKRPNLVHKWLGISIDEFSRAKYEEPDSIQRSVYPLLEMGFTRRDCVEYLQSVGVEVPPKSSCTFCPYHNRRAWQELKREGGPDWDRAVEFDQAIRDVRAPHQPYIKEENRDKAGRLYLHSDRKPLDEAVVLPEEIGQLEMFDRVEDEAGECTSGYCFL